MTDWLHCICISQLFFCFCPACRLKQKSQSVDIGSQGFSPTLVPASPLNKAAPPVAKTTAALTVQENNATNSQRRSPRCGELKRGYTIGNWHLGLRSPAFVNKRHRRKQSLQELIRMENVLTWTRLNLSWKMSRLKTPLFESLSKLLDCHKARLSREAQRT